jgi:hypothetical protein
MLKSAAITASRSTSGLHQASGHSTGQSGHLDGQAALHAGVDSGEGLHGALVDREIDNAVAMRQRGTSGCLVEVPTQPGWQPGSSQTLIQRRPLRFIAGKTDKITRSRLLPGDRYRPKSRRQWSVESGSDSGAFSSLCVLQ